MFDRRHSSFPQVYKVLSGSPADKDGRIRKGDRILSINGKSMKGITHRESLAILKVNVRMRLQVSIILCYTRYNITIFFFFFLGTEVRSRVGHIEMQIGRCRSRSRWTSPIGRPGDFDQKR